MKIHQLSIDEAFGALRSGPEGLSAAEALRRLEEYGPNRVERAAQEPAIWRLLKEFTQFFSVILWVAAGLAFVAEWSDPGHALARVRPFGNKREPGDDPEDHREELREFLEQPPDG